jgi:hypothetical protein
MFQCKTPLFLFKEGTAVNTSFFRYQSRIAVFFLTLLGGSPALASTNLQQVTLPDGLYLYQPYFGNEYHRVGGRETIRPLMIVEKGALVDPFLRAREIGFNNFLKRYVEGRTFHVYRAGNKVGTVENIQLRSCAETEKEFLPDIVGKVEKFGRDTFSQRDVKIVASSVLLTDSKNTASDQISIRALEQAQKFVVSTQKSNFAPSFLMGGTLDLDADAQPDVIVQRFVESRKEVDKFALSVEVLKHEGTKWTTTYKTSNVSCPANAYLNITQGDTK